MLQSAKEGIREAYSSEEYALIQAINAYLEASKSYNLVYERLTEWYGIYYPEVRVTNPSTLAQLALALTTDKPTYDSIYEAVKDEKKAQQIFEQSKTTAGRKMGADEREAVVSFAEMSESMKESMESLEDYIKKASGRMLPNTTYLTDEKIAAELLAKAGSMERLATMPASTVQLLGAEKSLFKHIKFGSKPPKYGVLFKMPVVNSAPRDQRGRIARVYATKISIALKADHYTKKFIGNELKKSLDEAVAKIKSSPPRPDRPQQEQRRQRFQGPGGNPRQQHQQHQQHRQHQSYPHQHHGRPDDRARRK